MNHFKSFFSVIIFFLLISSCQRNIDVFVPDNNNIGQILTPDPVQASITGKVIDQNENPVSGAIVSSGNNTTTTDSRGLFRFTNITVDKYAALVTVEFNGYFKGIRTFSCTEASANFVKIKLIPKVLAGTVDAATGGTASLGNGSSVILQAGSVIVKSTGQSYTGNINVYAAYIDPALNDISETVPGSFQAKDTGNFRVLLKSFGMLAVQLESPAGELLQIATGKTARLHFSIPLSLIASAPTAIPLWSLDETDGLWKQEGQATKNGNAYEGNVAHFSFWNCDAGSNTIYLEMNVNTVNGPLPDALVKITRTDNGNSSYGYGYSDSSGHVSGLVFSNETLQLEVINNCFETVYSQTIGPFSQNTNLGTIIVAAPAQYLLTVTGNAVDCSSLPVSSGNAFIYFEGQQITTPVINGSFSATITRCSSSAANVEVVVTDNSGQQQSTVWSGSAASGTVNTGSLTACGLSTNQFINYTINGAAYSYTIPADSIHQYSAQGTATSIFIGANSTSSLNIGMAYAGTAVGSSQLLQYFNSSLIDSSGGNFVFSPPIFVNITEFGSVGEYISGNFSGNLVINSPLATYAITCSFRVKRQF